MLEHKMIDGTELVGWLRGQQSTIPFPDRTHAEYEKIVIHVVHMMGQAESHNEKE